MTAAIIVQARMHSTRLPGKVLLKLGEETVLHHVLRRCAAVEGCDVVVCAIPEAADCDPIADEAKRAGAVAIRGSETDVLGRYYKAATAVDATIIMRVTSDCPLIDPEVCGEVLALRACEHADYASNNMPPSFPHGLDCEAFTFAALEAAANTATENLDREHVTPWLRRNEALRRANLAAPTREFSAQRWTLDFPEDYEFFRAVWAKLPPRELVGWREVAALVANDPTLAAINARHARPQ
ncbi:MAG: glycosyltransferase family protein [Xanthobacteraceae bacterium]|nr:glycosyltransferase family protein [Xanthobacteraceae bacterium]